MFRAPVVIRAYAMARIPRWMNRFFTLELALLLPLTFCLGSPFAGAEETSSSPVLPTELQAAYLQRSADSLENALGGLSLPKDAATAIPRLQVLQSIYARTGQAELQGMTQERLALAYRRLSEATQVPDLRSPENTLWALYRLFPDQSIAELASETKGSERDVASESDLARLLVNRSLTKLLKAERPVPEALLHSALALKASKDHQLAHGRARTLSTISYLALQHDQLDFAIGAFIEADLSHETIQAQPFSGSMEDLVEHATALGMTQAYLKQARSGIDAAALAIFKRAAPPEGQNKDYEKILNTADFSADIFALTGNTKYLWTAYYFIALVHKDLTDPSAQLAYLLKIADSFMRTDEEKSKKLLQDKLASGILVTAISMAHELIRTASSAEAEPEAATANLTPEKALEAGYLTLNALRRVAEILDKQGTHFQQLLLVIQLELRRSGRQPQAILNLYEELVDIYPAVGRLLNDQPAVREALDEQLGQINLLVFSLAFEKPVKTADDLQQARRSYELFLRGLNESKANSNSEIGYTLMWGELLLRNGLYEESLVVFEKILASPHLSSALLVLAQPLPSISVEGFVYNRIGLVHYRLGNWEEALRYQKQSREACREVKDRIGESRALQSMALLYHENKNWAVGQQHAGDALQVTLKTRMEEEQLSYSLPATVSEWSGDSTKAWSEVAGSVGGLTADASISATMPVGAIEDEKISLPSTGTESSAHDIDLQSLVTGSLAGLMQSATSISAIRWNDDGIAFLAAMRSIANPKALFLSDVLVMPSAKSLLPQKNAIAYVTLITTLGRCLQELGDPVGAEELYRHGEAVGRELALDQHVAEVLYLHARLYMDEHRYFSWFEDPPKKTLRWSLSEAESRNVLVARVKLAEAYRLVEKDSYSQLRMSIIATGVEAFRTDPEDPQELRLWVDRGSQEFSTYKALFRKDPRFVVDAEQRMALSNLYNGLSGYARGVSEEGDARQDRYDLVGAIDHWRKASVLYLVLDNDSAAGEMLTKEASVWHYLNKPMRELELLEAAASASGKGAVSYLPPSDSVGLAIPQLKIKPFGSYSISGVDFQKYRYHVDFGDIVQVEGTMDIGLHLTLIQRYLLSGKLDLANTTKSRVLARLQEDSVMGMMARLLLSGLYLKLGRPDEALSPLESTLIQARTRLADLARNLPIEEISLDLSVQGVNYEAKESAGLDEISFSGITSELMAYKNLMLIQISALYLLGQTQYQNGATEEAIATFHECAELSQKHKATALAADVHHRLGILYGQSDREQAVQHLTTARSLTPNPAESPGPFVGKFLAVEIRETLGRFYFTNGDWTHAQHYDWEAAEAYEAIRAILGVQELQTPIMGRLSDAYERLVVATLRAHRWSSDAERPRWDEFIVEQAFEFSERAKSRALLDILGSRRKGAGGAADGGTGDVAQAESQMRARIEALTGELKASREREGQSSRTQLLAAQLGGLHREYENLQIQRQMEEANTRFVEAIRPVRVAQLQLQLADLNGQSSQETVLLGYFVTQDETIVWMISEAGIDVDAIPISRSELQNKIQDFQAQLDVPFVSKPHSDPLYRLLLGKFADRITDKRLCVVPHGMLHKMPFGALRHSSKYLIETNSIFYLPSASLLSLLLQQSGTPSQSALVLADPDGSLEYSRLEASNIEGVFPEGEVRSFVGLAANKASFFSQYQRHSVIHFATHGFFNPRYPIFSSLVLSDGELLLSDVTRLSNFDAEIVVLSACNTGASRIASGDELIGLSGAFIRAGTSAVLVNLWSAEDDTTPLLIKRFYTHLILDKMPKDLALQEAQRSMIADGYNPISWGGFVLIGSVS